MVANLTYVCLFFATIGYAFLLEALRRNPDRSYVPRWTWLTVVVGVAIVGAFVALHLWALPAAPEPDRWQVWLAWLFHFIAGGIPIIAWQDYTDWRDQRAAERRRAERRAWPTRRATGE